MCEALTWNSELGTKDNMVTKEIIYDFCGNLSMDLQCLIPKLEKLHPEWSTRDLASNLMEFGRGQISGVGEPTDNDFDFYNRFLSALDMDNLVVALPSAYFAGCVMGLVQRGDLPPDEFVQAVELSRKFVTEQIETE